MTESKLALVLSGGGMGGAAHIGAIKALEEYGLLPEAVLGTSIGAFVGAVYASGATAEMLVDGWQEISRRDLGDLLDLDLTALRQAVTSLNHTYVTGILLGRALMSVQQANYVHVHTFSELGRLTAAERQARHVKEFYASATSLLDGIETIFCAPTELSVDENGLFEGRRLCHHASFVDAVRASFSLPAIFKPHRIDLPRPPESCPCGFGQPAQAPKYHLYVDGSVKDDYPITIAAKIAKADKIIGINLTKAGAKVNLTLNGGLPDLQSRILQIIGDDQYEADRADKDVARVDLLTIDPAIGDVAVFDLSKGDWLIERGYQAVKQCFKQKGLQPTFSREENLNRLFPPLLVDHCPDCGQVLPVPRDLGSDELFVTDLPATSDLSKATASPPAARFTPSILTVWRPGLILLGLFLLFVVGGFQFWWVYYLANGQGHSGTVFIGGGLIYIITVLVASSAIGSWLLSLLKGTLGQMQKRKLN